CCFDGPASSDKVQALVCAFTPQQIGQLHCLMYEHVQLLVQVFSLSIIEPFKQHISSQVDTLLSEMLQKRFRNMIRYWPLKGERDARDQNAKDFKADFDLDLCILKYPLPLLLLQGTTEDKSNSSNDVWEDWSAASINWEISDNDEENCEHMTMQAASEATECKSKGKHDGKIFGMTGYFTCFSSSTQHDCIY
ncbi:hypothetical protein Tco_1415589, partial [Tanacetum coccineum]